MKDWHDDRRVRHDVITIPVLWLAIALSLLVHVAALLGLLPRLPLLTHNAPSPGDEVSAPLTATLAGPSTPVPESRPPTVVAEAARELGVSRPRDRKTVHEIGWILHGAVVHLAIRRHLYGTSQDIDEDKVLRLHVCSFIAGFAAAVEAAKGGVTGASRMR